LPNVEAWYQRLAERAPYRDHVMRHFGTNPDEWAALEKACVSEGVK
jgi:glutathione S-transferase